MSELFPLFAQCWVCVHSLHKKWNFLLRISSVDVWSHLLKKSLMGNSIFCAMIAPLDDQKSKQMELSEPKDLEQHLYRKNALFCISVASFIFCNFSSMCKKLKLDKTSFFVVLFSKNHCARNGWVTGNNLNGLTFIKILIDVFWFDFLS